MTHSDFDYEKVQERYKLNNTKITGIYKSNDSESIFDRSRNFLDNGNGTAFAKEHNKWSLIDTSFKSIIADQFDSVEQKMISKGSYIRYASIVYKNGKCGFIDCDGKFSVPLIYKSINQTTSEYLADKYVDYIWVVSSKDKQGWFNLKTGKEQFN
jgi:hypothetical protein